MHGGKGQKTGEKGKEKWRDKRENWIWGGMWNLMPLRAKTSFFTESKFLDYDISENI